ncbi:MAG: prolyl oligopeptidase family serine peptidase [Cytophagales bacterium]|nr:prolyl oligopeptidase family serine peptidase [Cytophagales bacterium]
MEDESIPLTTGEFDEWGNPENPESYMYMLDYSPYDQVKPQNYPNMLVTTGFHDCQVQYCGTGQMGGQTARTEN